jgi:hypothetical protein
MGYRSDDEIARDAAQFDSGYCNPRKIKAAGKARQDAVDSLMDRGHSRKEAERMIQNEE